MCNQLIEGTAALIVLLPIHLILGHFRQKPIRLLYFLFSVYLAAVYHLTGLPTVQFITFDVTVNLIPFKEVRKEQVLSVLNVAMFVPLGFFLPLLWKKYQNILRTLLFGLGATVTIELMQLLTLRITDINDLITNTLGAFLGYLLFLCANRRISGFPQPQSENTDLWQILFLTGGAMFFLQPLLATLLYSIV